MGINLLGGNNKPHIVQQPVYITPTITTITPINKCDRRRKIIVSAAIIIGTLATIALLIYH